MFQNIIYVTKNKDIIIAIKRRKYFKRFNNYTYFPCFCNINKLLRACIICLLFMIPLWIDTISKTFLVFEAFFKLAKSKSVSIGFRCSYKVVFELHIYRKKDCCWTRRRNVPLITWAMVFKLKIKKLLAPSINLIMQYPLII